MNDPVCKLGKKKWEKWLFHVTQSREMFFTEHEETSFKLYGNFKLWINIVFFVEYRWYYINIAILNDSPSL
jgi:hypothetical protein